jgi:hypothetical protein
MNGHKTPNHTSGKETPFLNLLLNQKREGREDEVGYVSSYRMALTKRENNVS